MSPKPTGFGAWLPLRTNEPTGGVIDRMCRPRRQRGQARALRLSASRQAAPYESPRRFVTGEQIVQHVVVMRSQGLLPVRSRFAAEQDAVSVLEEGVVVRHQDLVMLAFEEQGDAGQFVLPARRTAQQIAEADCRPVSEGLP